MSLPEKYLGFAMVLIGNFFWKQQFLAVPFDRRLLLLPHCLKHAEGCPADYDEFGLDCEKCGACSIADYKVRAEELGYKVLVAEGSPIVLKIIVGGLRRRHPRRRLPERAGKGDRQGADRRRPVVRHPAALRRLQEHVARRSRGSGTCSTSTSRSPSRRRHSYVPLMRAANRLFDERLRPAAAARPQRRRPKRPTSPLGQTEDVAYDWLANGGKRFRPFITLAAYDAIDRSGNAGSLGCRRTTSTLPGRASAAWRWRSRRFTRRRSCTTTSRTTTCSATAARRCTASHGAGHGDQRRRLPDRPGLPAGQLGAAANSGPTSPPTFSTGWPTAHIKLCDGQGAEMAWQNAPDCDADAARRAADLRAQDVARVRGGPVRRPADGRAGRRSTTS